MIATEPVGSEWLIDGLLHNQGSLLVSAAFKSGKTTLALNMVHALTTGKPFLNDFHIPEPLRVAYFDLELGARLARRWFMDMQPDTSMVKYVDLKGMGRKLDVRSDARLEQIVEMLRGNHIDVVIIDPLSALCSSLGISENSNEEVRPLMDRLDAMVVEAGCQGLVVIHHTGKDSSKGARGASAFQDWSSVNAYLTKAGDNGVSKFHAKGRDVDIKPVELSYDTSTRMLSVERTGSGDDIFFWGKQGAPLTAAEVMAALGVSRATAIKRLEAADGWTITQHGQGRNPDIWEYRRQDMDPFA